MTDLPPEGTAPGAGAADQAPQLRVLAQYVKDSSFENPGAPLSFRATEGQPQIQMAIDLGLRRVEQDADEVSIRISATAKRGEETVFIAELLYAGLFAFINVPEADRQPLALVECPRLLFPFARQIIADMTRDGGFPPLMLEPIDFGALYRQRLIQQQQEGGGGDANNGGQNPGGPASAPN